MKREPPPKAYLSRCPKCRALTNGEGTSEVSNGGAAERAITFRCCVEWDVPVRMAARESAAGRRA